MPPLLTKPATLNHLMCLCHASDGHVHAKLKKDLNHALVVSCVLNSEKAKLGVDHARLKEEFDILYKAHKVLKDAHASLKESHVQLQVKLTKEKGAFLHMVLIDNANATNPCCEHVHLVEENAKLNEQLEKGLDTSPMYL